MEEQLRGELGESVPRAEYERLKQAWRSLSTDVEKMREQVELVRTQAATHSERADTLLSEKREFYERFVEAEQAMSESKRDLELKEIKIESLENIIRKREQSVQA